MVRPSCTTLKREWLILAWSSQLIIRSDGWVILLPFPLPPFLHSFESPWVSMKHQTQHQALEIPGWIFIVLRQFVVKACSLVKSWSHTLRKGGGGSTFTCLQSSPLLLWACSMVYVLKICSSTRGSIWSQVLCPLHSGQAPWAFHTEQAPVFLLYCKVLHLRPVSSLPWVLPIPNSTSWPPTAHLQTLRQYMPHQLLSAFPKFNLSFKAHIKIQLHPLQQSQSLQLKEQ